MAKKLKMFTRKQIHRRKLKAREEAKAVEKEEKAEQRRLNRRARKLVIMTEGCDDRHVDHVGPDPSYPVSKRPAYRKV